MSRKYFLFTDKLTDAVCLHVVLWHCIWCKIFTFFLILIHWSYNCVAWAEKRTQVSIVVIPSSRVTLLSRQLTFLSQSLCCFVDFYYEQIQEVFVYSRLHDCPLHFSSLAWSKWIVSFVLWAITYASLVKQKWQIVHRLGWTKKLCMSWSWLIFITQLQFLHLMNHAGLLSMMMLEPVYCCRVSFSRFFRSIQM